jgi:long-chain acyl-CoA synthetase
MITFCTIIDNVLGYILQAMTTFVGGSIAFEDKIQFNDFNLDMESVLATIKEFKPTIYARFVITNNLPLCNTLTLFSTSGAPFLKQAQKLIANKYGTSFIFQRGLDRKDRYHREGRLVSDCVYDMFLFRQIRMSMFGGQIHTLFMDDDDSPTNKVDLASFYRAVLGAQVIKTFSRPETTSGMTATMIYDYTADKRIVGPPLAAMEIKLSDHKEYTAEDNPNPRGEVKVRGNNVFAGYWDDTERTRMDLVDPDGWFSTGMIGELLPNGSFMLLGPKKHL